jgi:hypothetical protein
VTCNRHCYLALSARCTCSSRLRLKCDGTRAEIRFRLSAKQTSPFKSAGASVQSTTGCRGVHISGSNAGYTMFRGSVKSTGYPLHSQVSPSLPLPCHRMPSHFNWTLHIFVCNGKQPQHLCRKYLVPLYKIRSPGRLGAPDLCTPGLQVVLLFVH